jgi:site-specific DNA-methyltransferase (adenine-specific)
VLDAEFRFTLDPCSSDTNARCVRHFTRREDGLAQDWTRDVVFMNPPYGREIGQWMRKAHESARAGAIVVCLVPARTDTAWWHTYAVHGEIRFLRGRLKFGDAAQGAPFPSAIVVFRPGCWTGQHAIPDSRARPHTKRASNPWCVMRCVSCGDQHDR